MKAGDYPLLRAVRLFGSALLIGLCPAAGSVNAETSVEDVCRAWRARQERVRSLRIEWVETFTNTASAESRMMRPGDPAPEQKTTTRELRRGLVMDGDRVRHSSFGEKLSHIEGGYVDRPYISVFNGEFTASHYDKGRGRGPNARTSLGFVNPGYGEKDNYHVDPVVYHYRMLSTLTNYAQEDFSLSREPNVVAGTNCVVVQRLQTGKPDVICKYYVDPEQDFSIRRYVVTTGNPFPFVRVDIDYQQDPSGEWVPAAWEATMLVSTTGAFRAGAKANVTSYALNPPVAAEEFDYKFPADTLVRDTRGGGDKRYVVREGGETRLVARAESRAGGRDFVDHYQRLVATESGKSYSQPEGGSSLGWPAYCGILLAPLVVLLAVVIRRRRAPKRPETTEPRG